MILAKAIVYGNPVCLASFTRSAYSFRRIFLGSLKAQIMHRLAGTFPEKVVQIDCDPLDVRVGFAIFL